MKRLQETLKQVNGTTTTECSSVVASDVEEKSTTNTIDLAAANINPEDQQYETVVNFQNGQLISLFVERLPIRSLPTIPSESSDASSEKSASNGSTTSLGPFVLPGSLTHTASGLSVSSSSSGVMMCPRQGEKSSVKGVSGLRGFLQDLLKKLPEEEKKRGGRTPKGRQTAQAAAAFAFSTTSTTPVKATTPVTTPTRASASPKVPEPSPVTAKKTVAFAATADPVESQVGNFVMARWADKRYYAGRVSAEKPGKKFAVRFEDGATRTLTKEHLIFGGKIVAESLMDHECNVLVEANVYETGLVVAIDADAGIYSVLTDSSTVKVPASDLYLDEEQAKAVQQGTEKGDGGSVDGGEKAPAPVQAATATATTTTSGRRKRNSDILKSSPEAGPSSVAEPAAKKSRKR